MPTRVLPLLALVLLLPVGCASSKPAQPEPDPVTEPTAIGAVDEAARQASIEGSAAEHSVRGISRVAGVLAAVFGGPHCETIDETIERYRLTRDAVRTTAAVIGGTHGAVEGAKRGIVFDQQFAELHALDGVDAYRPQPDEIIVRLGTAPSDELLSRVAAVFSGRETRAIDIEAAGDAATRVRDSLAKGGVPDDSMRASRNDDVADVVIRIRYRD